MKCTKCGHENYEGAAFCEECGKPLRTGETPHEAGERVGGEAAPIRHPPAPSLNLEVHRTEGRDGQVKEVEREEGTEQESAGGLPPSEKDTEAAQGVEPAPAGEPEEAPARAAVCAKKVQEKKLSEGDLREVLVEIENRQWRVGWVNLLNFRLTNLTDSTFKANLSAEISLVDQKDRRRSHALPPESIAKTFGLHFTADAAGLRVVKDIQLRLDRSDGKDGQARIYRVPDDSVQIEVLSKDEDTRHSIVIQGDVKIDVHDLYACDGVNVSALGQLQEQKQKEEKSGVFWQPIRMIFDAEATKAAGEKRVKGNRVIVAQEPRVAGLQEAKLEIDDGRWTRKIFLFAKESIWMGRDAVLESGDRNDVALRFLDSNPWKKTYPSLAISRRHGMLYLQNNHVHYRDMSTMGTYISHEKLHHMRILLPELCTISMAGVLKLSVRTFRAKSKKSLVITKNDSAVWRVPDGMTTDLGMENLGEIDAVRLRRLDGVRHEYVMLARQAIVGSNKEDPIFVEGEGVEEIHARILFYKGEFLIRSETQTSPTVVDGYRLRPEEYCPLAPGKVIRLGKTEVRFEAIEPEDFKHA